MGKEIITFGNIEIESHKFLHYRYPFFKMMWKLITYRYLVWFLQVKVVNILLFKRLMITNSNHYA